MTATESIIVDTDSRVKGPTTRWVAFVLANETYAVPVTSVQEIVNVEDVSIVAGAPDFVLGIVNLRGTVVTVLDLNKRLMMPSKPWEVDLPILILESGPVTVGVIVDGIREVVDIEDSLVEPPPAVIRSGGQSSTFITGVANVEEGIIILIDVDQLLLEAREAAEQE